MTARINEAQQANGLTRTEWQILNTLHEIDQASRQHVAEILHPFGDAAAIGAALEGLIARGLVEETEAGAGEFTLTAQGRERHASALAVQQQIRRQPVKVATSLRKNGKKAPARNLTPSTRPDPRSVRTNGRRGTP